MTYSIVVRVIQNNPAKWFSIVEKTMWHKAKDGGGTWVECDGEQTLSIGTNRSFGTLRFKNSENEYFSVALGVHKNIDNQELPEKELRWCDIQTQLSASKTGVDVNADYYAGGRTSIPPAHRLSVTDYITEDTGTVTVHYWKKEGSKSYATITINY